MAVIPKRLLDQASWSQRVGTVTGDWRKKRQIDATPEL
jgi:hypothetical protein